MNRGWTDEQENLRFKKIGPNQDVFAPKANYDGNGDSKLDKHICTNFEKKHFGNYLTGATRCYGYGKNLHKVRDCPTLLIQFSFGNGAYNGPIFCEYKKNYFYVLQSNKEENTDEGADKLLFFFYEVMGSF